MESVASCRNAATCRWAKADPFASISCVVRVRVRIRVRVRVQSWVGYKGWGYIGIRLGLSATGYTCVGLYNIRGGGLLSYTRSGFQHVFMAVSFRGSCGWDEKPTAVKIPTSILCHKGACEA